MVSTILAVILIGQLWSAEGDLKALGITATAGVFAVVMYVLGVLAGAGAVRGAKNKA